MFCFYRLLQFKMLFKNKIMLDNISKNIKGIFIYNLENFNTQGVPKNVKVV